jgi:3-oxoadipate enol-lactonase
MPDKNPSLAGSSVASRSIANPVPAPRPAAPPLRVVPPGERLVGLNSPPPGRWLDLGRRGRTWIREEPGPEGAPALLMLHGLGATGGLNWAGSQLFLGDQFRVITIDHRGHGRGIRTRDFRLEDCADDAAACIEALGLDRPIAVGYSMGGPVASLLWRRHPELISGLVLCATGATFSGSPGERLTFGAMRVAGRAPMKLPRRALQAGGGLAGIVPLPKGLPKDVQWAIDEMTGHDPRSIVQAIGEIGRFDASTWIGQVDIPTAVVVTAGDQIVPVGRQLDLARAIHHASVYSVDGGHLCISHGDSKRSFLSTLRDACLEVAAAGSGRQIAL